MYQIISPPAQLKNVIRHYWLLDLSESAVNRKELMFAYPYVNLVFTLGSAYSVKPRNSDSIRIQETRVLGPRTLFAEYNHPVGNFAFGITFQFGKASSFFRESAENLLNQIIPLSTILPLQNWMSDAFSEIPFNRFIRLINNHFEESINSSENGGESLWDHFLYKIIVERNFNTSILDISNQLNVSQRHLQRICLQYAALSPKSIQSLFRCRLAVRQIGKTGRITDLFDFGYFDQSHFIKDVRRWTGAAPGSLFNQLTRQSAL